MDDDGFDDDDMFDDEVLETLSQLKDRANAAFDFIERAAVIVGQPGESAASYPTPG